MKYLKLRKRPNYGYYYFVPYMVTLICFIVFGSLTTIIGKYNKNLLISYFGLGTIVYGVVTTVGWLLARYVIPGNRIKVAQSIIDKLNLKGNEIVLDIGSGRGIFAIECAKKICTGKVFGIDLWEHKNAKEIVNHHKMSQPSGNSIENAIENAKMENVSQKIEFINMDANSLKFSDSKFDVVICGFVIGHLWKYRNTIIDQISIKLKSGGKIVIVDNYRCLTYFLLSTPHFFVQSYIRGKKAKYLTVKNWQALLHQNGFRIIENHLNKGIINLIAIK